MQNKSRTALHDTVNITMAKVLVIHTKQFQNMGLDYLGPLLSKNKDREKQKIWACLSSVLQ